MSGPENIPEPTGYHWGGGWWFQQLGDGSVRILLVHRRSITTLNHKAGDWVYDIDITVPRNEWESIVKAMSLPSKS
jgi:hypothetical protein